jgi:hypothetical protein
MTTVMHGPAPREARVPARHSAAAREFLAAIPFSVVAETERLVFSD